MKTSKGECLKDIAVLLIKLNKRRNLTTASTLQILWHAACRNNNASCAPSPVGTDLKVKPMLGRRLRRGEDL